MEGAGLRTGSALQILGRPEPKVSQDEGVQESLPTTTTTTTSLQPLAVAVKEVASS